MSSENNNEYDHIDFRINIIYDAVYSNSPSQYIFRPITKSSITLLDIKMPDEFNSSHVFENELQFINKYNNRLYYRRISDASHTSTISFGRYHGMGNVNDMGRGELYNPAMHYLLSELVINEKFKHILLPLMFFDTTLGEMKKIVPDIHEKIVNDPTMNQNAIDQSKIHVFITEHYFKMQSLREYIKDNFDKMTINHWKVIIFQVIYALYKISERLQKFRHNWLNLDSIRMYLKPEGGTVQYKMGQTIFEVPNMGFEIKISDFSFSSTSDHVRNKDTRLIQENPYYDIHYFISSIYLYLTKEHGSVPENLMKFISDIIPSRFLPSIDEKFDGLNEQEFDSVSSVTIVPAHVLRKNGFFSEFLKFEQSRQKNNTADKIPTQDITMSASPIENKKIKIEKLNYKENGIDYLSITDNSSEEPRMLARKISSNKKISEQYYNKEMIEGSRKIISGFNSHVNNESGVFKKAESKMARSKKENTDDSDDKLKKKSKDSKKHRNKHAMKKINSISSTSSASDNSSDKGWEGNADTINIPELESTEIDQENFNTVKQAEKIIEALKEVGKHRKKNHKSSKSSKSKKLSENSSTDDENTDNSNREDDETSSVSSLSNFKLREYSAGSNKSSKSKKNKDRKQKKSSKSKNLTGGSESSENSTNSHQNELDKVNKNLYKLDKEFAKKLENAPKGFIGHVPDHIINQLEAGNSFVQNSLQYPAEYFQPQMQSQMQSQMQLPMQPPMEGFGMDQMMMSNQYPTMMPQYQSMQQLPQMAQMPPMQQMPQMASMAQIGPMAQMGQMPPMQNMGLEQMFQGMQGNLPQSNQSNQLGQLGLPMMSMSGGGKKNNEKTKTYNFVKDGQVVDHLNKDFFF